MSQICLAAPPLRNRLAQIGLDSDDPLASGEVGKVGVAIDSLDDMLNDALYEHVQNGNVEPKDAYLKAVDKAGFESMLTRGGFKL